MTPTEWDTAYLNSTVAKIKATHPAEPDTPTTDGGNYWLDDGQPLTQSDAIEAFAYYAFCASIGVLTGSAFVAWVFAYFFK